MSRVVDDIEEVEDVNPGVNETKRLITTYTQFIIYDNYRRIARLKSGFVDTDKDMILSQFKNALVHCHNNTNIFSVEQIEKLNHLTSLVTNG